MRVLLLGPLLWLAACGREAPAEGGPPPDLMVFAAASLIDVLPEVAAAWREEGGGEVRFSFGPTSKLVAQVVEGAPADALVSADVAWIERLEASGRSDPAARVLLAGNALVFVVPADAGDAPAAAERLPGRLARIALAGENVPAGRYAKAALERAGVWAAVAPRVVRGEDVRLTLRWVATGDVPGGVVYATDAQAEPRVRLAFVFPADGHPPIVYPAAPVRRSARAAEAARFLAFCRGARGQAVFARHGFRAPGP